MDDTALLDENKEERTRLIPASGYSIPQLIEKINPIQKHTLNPLIKKCQDVRYKIKRVPITHRLTKQVGHHPHKWGYE